LVFYRLVILGQAGEAEIAAELRRDPTGQGTEHAARCRAALPDTDAKARAWATVVQDDNGSARLLAATADGFWQPEQEELTAGYVPRYFVDLPAIASRRSAMSLLHVASFGYPRFAVSADTVTAAEALLTRDDLDPMLRRVVVDATDELRRALAARAFG
jgi:aminopeptidase N